MKTLLIIDAQKDFMPGGALEVPEGDQIIPVFNSIQDKFDLVVAAQDWHPQDHVSFASNHPGKSEFDQIQLHGNPQTLWPDHCVQNSDGSRFHPDLETRRWEAIFRKGTDKSIDSYSAFYDNGRLKSTGLAGYLKEKGVSEIYFGGLAADICVYYSIIDALNEGFSCFLIQDATRALDEEKYEQQKKELKEKGVRLIYSKDIE